MQKCCDVQYDILPAKVYSIGVYCGRHPTITSFHPGKLTWKPNMKVWKMIFLLVWVIFRSHVIFLACLLVWFQRFTSYQSCLDISHQHSRGIIRVPNDPLLSKTEEAYLSPKKRKKKHYHSIPMLVLVANMAWNLKSPHWKGKTTSKPLPSWELTYPLPRQFWRWFSFFKGGIS